MALILVALDLDDAIFDHQQSHDPLAVHVVVDGQPFERIDTPTVSGLLCGFGQGQRLLGGCHDIGAPTHQSGNFGMVRE
jgi:hypothetical protein